MPGEHFEPGDPCMLVAMICNHESTAMVGVPFFVVLDVFGQYYFGPGFTTELNYWIVDVAPGLLQVQIIPVFLWPSGAGSAEGLVFYGAMTDPQITTIIGDLGSWTFSYSE